MTAGQDARAVVVGEALAAHRLVYPTHCACGGWRSVIVADAADGDGVGVRAQHDGHVTAAVLAALDAGGERASGLGEDEAAGLLHEWYAQWEDRPDMPSKMGDALHVRTALFFARTAPPASDGEGLRAAVEALGDETPECWVTRSTDVSCIDYIGGKFSNDAEWTAAMCCLPCRLRALLAATPDGGGV